MDAVLTMAPFIFRSPQNVVMSFSLSEKWFYQSVCVCVCVCVCKGGGRIGGTLDINSALPPPPKVMLALTTDCINHQVDS